MAIEVPRRLPLVGQSRHSTKWPLRLKIAVGAAGLLCLLQGRMILDQSTDRKRSLRARQRASLCTIWAVRDLPFCVPNLSRATRWSSTSGARLNRRMSTYACRGITADSHVFAGAASAAAPPITCPKPNLAMGGFSTSLFVEPPERGVFPLLICSPLAFLSAASRSFTALASSSSLNLS